MTERILLEASRGLGTTIFYHLFRKKVKEFFLLVVQVRSRATRFAKP